MTDEERYRAFIQGLTALTKETRVEICGCGCCDSPWLDIISGDDEITGEYRTSAYTGAADHVTFYKEAKADE